MDELESYIDSLERLKYQDLQKFAKRYGIRANLKAEKIIDRLRKLAKKPSSPEYSAENVQTEEKDSKQNADKDDNIQIEACSQPLDAVEPTNNVQNNIASREVDTTKEQGRNVMADASPRRATSTGNVRKNVHTSASSQTRRSMKEAMYCKGPTPLSEKHHLVRGVTPNKGTPSLRKRPAVRGIVTNKRTPSLGKSPLVRRVVSDKGRPSFGKSPLEKGITPSKVIPSHGKRPSVGGVSMSKVGPSRTAASSGERRKKKQRLNSQEAKTPTSASKLSHSVTQSRNSLGSGRKRNSVDKNKTGERLDALQDESGSPKPRSRRDTYVKGESSPGVDEMLSAMREDMTDKEQKDVLLDKLNERVQRSKVNSQGPSSNIPRYVGVNKTVDTKKKTPVKDWNKIHQLHWNKMDSIDEYLAKKRKRTESMTQSVKKLRMLTEQIRSDFHQSLKKPTTPVSEKKQNSTVKQICESKKSKQAKSKITLFRSPSPAIFKPSVTSVSKANFNFHARDVVSTKTPVRPVRKSPRFNSAAKLRTGELVSTADQEKMCTESKMLRSSATKENAVNHTLSSKKQAVPNGNVSIGTPFKQSINNSLPINSTKTFNIADSLAKPITWKPHKGKLKPFQIGSMYVHQVDIKEVKVKSREDRRKEHRKQRVEKRLDVLAKRRGIDV